MYGRHTQADHALSGPLEERGLLRVIEPKDWVDSEVTEKLAEVIVELLTNGAFDQLPQADYFAELSQSSESVTALMWSWQDSWSMS